MARTNPSDQSPNTAELARTGGQEPSIALMLEKVIDKGVTTENVAALQAMVDLYKSVKLHEAEREFASAFKSLMGDIPKIQATKAVPNNDGSVRYKFAPIEEIDRQLRPIALEHGFTYWFSEAEAPTGRITAVCNVQHVSGHQRAIPYTVRTSAPPKASDTQADGSTHSYAKRNALCNAFGIIVEHQDDDARLLGKPIGKALAEDLKARVKACGANEQAFLKFAGVAANDPAAKVEDYEQISDARYDMLNELLERKEMGKGKRNDQGEYDF